MGEFHKTLSWKQVKTLDKLHLLAQFRFELLYEKCPSLTQLKHLRGLLACEPTFAPATVGPLDRCIPLTAFTELGLDTTVEEDSSWAVAHTKCYSWGPRKNMNNREWSRG